jgi:hypothetical protein
MISRAAAQCVAAEKLAVERHATPAACLRAAAKHFLRNLRYQHFLALAVVLLSIYIAFPRQQQPMSQHSCQLLQQSFNSSAVIAGLQVQQQAAAAAAAGSAAPQLHILTIIGSNTPTARVDGSPLMQSLPPAVRSRVKVLRANTRIGHGLEGFGAFGAKIIEVGGFLMQPAMVHKGMSTKLLSGC